MSTPYIKWMRMRVSMLRALVASTAAISAVFLFSFSVEAAESSDVSNVHDRSSSEKQWTDGNGDPPSRPADEHIPAELIQNLLSWIESSTHYDVSRIRNEPPRIDFAESGDVILYQGQALLLTGDLRALYDVTGRRIYLIRPWAGTKVADVSSLLHELVHDVQFRNRTWPCDQAPEFQAYKLQAKWLAERGMRVNFNWLEIRVLSSCTGAIHP